MLASTLFKRSVAAVGLLRPAGLRPVLGTASLLLQRSAHTGPDSEEKPISPRRLGTIAKKERTRERQRKRLGKPRRYNKRNTVAEKQQRIDDAVGTPETELVAQEEEAQRLGLPWKITYAAIIERLPLLTTELEPWEQAYEEMMERRMELFAKEYPDGFAERTSGPELDSTEDRGPNFQRRTEDDLKDNRRSLNRALDKRLYLLVKPVGGEWVFPRSRPHEKYKMRDTVVKKMTRELGKAVELHPLGYCPMGFTQTPFPEAERQELQMYGEKVFYFRSQLVNGHPRISKKKYEDYAWITVDTLEDYFKDEKFCNYMRQVLGPFW